MDEIGEMIAGQRRYRAGWRRIVFPGIWLVYLLQTAAAVGKHAHGAAAFTGYAIIVAFCVLYLTAMPLLWSPHNRRFWLTYAALYVLWAAEVPFAHEMSFVMFVYLAVLTIGGLPVPQAVPVVAVLAVAATVVPALVGSWHSQARIDNGFTVGVVALAMYGFFGIVRTNVALAAARSEVARLAAENERTRIARDVHDLLGHSLTTITVKAGLARRLALRDPERAETEMGEVEGIARRALADVRAAVYGYREVTLAGELATAREVLRAAGVTAILPGAVDAVDEKHQELFGWIVREGVTNVVRHARAQTCTVEVGPSWVEILDDGRSALGVLNGAGNGLNGVRERVEAAGGTVAVGAVGRSGGWRLRVDVP